MIKLEIMAIYTAEELSGAGILNSVALLNSGNAFAVTNPCSSSAYFTMETVRDISGSYNALSPTNALGIYSGLKNIASSSLITSSYISSVCILGGSIGEFEFSPNVDVETGTSYFRATGGISVVTA
jgi:hypothetical protein